MRGADGRLSIHRSGSDAFAVKEWLAADGDARLPDDKSLGAGLPLRRGRLHRQACRRQAGLARASRPTPSRRTAPAPPSWSRAAKRRPTATALAIDRKVARGSGAIALQRAGEMASKSPRRGRRARTALGARLQPPDETGAAPPPRGRNRATRRRSLKIWKPGD